MYMSTHHNIHLCRSVYSLIQIEPDTLSECLPDGDQSAEFTQSTDTKKVDYTVIQSPDCQPLSTTPPQGYQTLPTPSPPEYHIDDSDCKLSYSNLPDDYLKYSCNVSGPNLSTQLFYADSSSAGNGIIDLANFVTDSKDAPPSYSRANSLKPDYIKLEECIPVDGCDDQMTDDSGSSLLRYHREGES